MGQWLDGGDPGLLDDAIDELRQVVPEKGTSLLAAFESIDTLMPPPDNVILLTDGLPTLCKAPARRGTVNAKQRLKLFDQAYEQVAKGIPVNILLFPIEGDPRAASSFWQLAMATRGSFLSLSEDWP
jgi:hypothetical protein